MGTRLYLGMVTVARALLLACSQANAVSCLSKSLHLEWDGLANVAVSSGCSLQAQARTAAGRAHKDGGTVGGYCSMTLQMGL